MGASSARCDLCLPWGGQLTVLQGYISRIASIPQESVTNIGVRVVVIGCGEWDAIQFYKGTEIHDIGLPSSSSTPKLSPTDPVTI